MNSELLTDLTAAPAAAEALVAAARRHNYRRRQRQSLGIAVAAVLALAVAFVLLPVKRHAPGVVQTTAPSHMLTQNELLDSFGDRPVALVTWPDGRQQLLAIAEPVAAR